jgi:hypothetical protein
MGDVYKARDTRLDRIIAVKISKTEFTDQRLSSNGLVADVSLQKQRPSMML